jgi:predicted RNA binding protein YcfA (HicA-like mRNA interferase family)
MSSKLPSVNAKDLIRIIEKKGFIKVRQSGSHAIFKNNSGLRTTVPIHSKKTIGKGLLKQIMRDTDISIEDFMR